MRTFVPAVVRGCEVTVHDMTGDRGEGHLDGLIEQLIVELVDFVEPRESFALE